MADNNNDNEDAPNQRGRLREDVRLRHREVAEREASRLARPEAPVGKRRLGHASRARSAVSSTPFGVSAKPRKKAKCDNADDDNEEDEEEEEEWCGPFSVARQMIAAREEARRKREASQENSNESHPLDDVDVFKQAELEQKKKANPSMNWKGKSTTFDHRNLYVKRRQRHASWQRRSLAKSTMEGTVPSLFGLCINFLVEHFDSVEALGNAVDHSVRKALCEVLVARGKMNGAAFDTIAEVGIESLELVDCAEVTEAQMAESLRSLIPGGLRALILNHAGRCFGPLAVRAIVESYESNAGDDEEDEEEDDNEFADHNRGKSNLFALSIGGAYMLRDSDAASLIRAGSSSLTSVEFCACPLLGKTLCEAIGQSFASSNKGVGSGCLLELSLSDIPMNKEDLMLMASEDALLNLKSLSIREMASVDDDVIATLLEKVGDQLGGIDLTGDTEITDATLSSIRKCNSGGTLRSLRLGGLKNLTAAGLETFFTRGIEGLPNPPSLRELDLSSCDVSAACDDVFKLAAAASSTKQSPSDSTLTVSSINEGKSTTSTVDSHKKEASVRSVVHDERNGIVPSAFGGLVRVNMNGSSITDRSMEALASSSASSLEELDVGFCPHVSDKGLGYLVSKVGEQFSTLRVWGCAQLTDEFFDGHARADVGGGLEIVGAWMKQSGRGSVR